MSVGRVWRPDDKGQAVSCSQETTVPRVVAHMVNSCVRTKVVGSKGVSASSSTGGDARRNARRFFLNTGGGDGIAGDAIGCIAGVVSGMEGVTSVDTEETDEGTSGTVGAVGMRSREGIGDVGGGCVNAEESNESKSYGCGEAAGAGVSGIADCDDDGEKRWETDVWNFFAKSEANDCVIERADFISMESRLSSDATSSRIWDDALS